MSGPVTGITGAKSINCHHHLTSSFTQHFDFPSSHMLEVPSSFWFLQGLPACPFGYQSKRACNCASKHPKAPAAFHIQSICLKNGSCEHKGAWWWMGRTMYLLLQRPWHSFPHFTENGENIPSVLPSFLASFLPRFLLSSLPTLQGHVGSLSASAEDPGSSLDLLVDYLEVFRQGHFPQLSSSFLTSPGTLIPHHSSGGLCNTQEAGWKILPQM